MDNPTPAKPCSKCGETKPLNEFSPSKKGLHGRQAICKACYRAYRAANPEKVRAQQARYYEANRDQIVARAKERDDPEARRAYYLANRERIREQQRLYRLANADAKKARDAEYREANRERLRQYHREWRAANPHAVALNIQRRRARLLGSMVGPVDLDALWTGTCGICGDTLDRDIKWPDPMSKSVDHIVPIAKGGGHVQDNLQWAHLDCNRRKGARLPT